MKKIILLLPLFLTGCVSNVLHSVIYNGGQNLKEAAFYPKKYETTIKTERMEQQQLECTKSFHEFKEKYFSDESNSLFQNIYMTLDNTNCDSLITRLKTEGVKEDKGKLVLNKNIDKNNPLLLFLLYNDLDTYVNTAGKFVEGVEKRKNYKEFMIGEERPSYGLGEWPKNSNVCDSFYDQEEYKKLVKNHKLAKKLANDIYDYAYGQEEKDFYKKTGIYVGGINILVPYMNGTEGSPISNHLYYLNGLQVFQNIPGGFLASLRGGLGYSDNLIFVATNRQFVDNTALDNIAVLLTGTKTYNTILGSNKTIYAFKIIDTAPYKKILNNYYFYPAVKNNIDEKTLEKVMQQLFTVIQ